MRASAPVLRVEGACKTYRAPPTLLRPIVRTATTAPVAALSGVSLSVESGEVVGLIGPNGAGKTTLIKAIATLLELDDGYVEVAGSRVDDDPLAVRRSLGVVLAEERGVYWRMNGRQNLELFGVLAGLPRHEARRRATVLLEQAGLAGVDKRTFGYSTGMRGRLNIARALLVTPPLLVLDEPTRSLDPIASERVQAMIRAMADEGTAVVWSSHRLDEVAAICDRVVVLVDTRVRFTGSVAELDDGHGGASGLSDLLRDPDSGAGTAAP